MTYAILSIFGYVGLILHAYIFAFLDPKIIFTTYFITLFIVGLTINLLRGSPNVSVIIGILIAVGISILLRFDFSDTIVPFVAAGGGMLSVCVLRFGGYIK